MTPRELEAKLKEIDRGWEVITDTNEIYFSEIFEHSTTFEKRIDPRQKGKRKPILVRGPEYDVLIEWNYLADGRGWMAFNDVGDIISEGERRTTAMYDVYLWAEDV